MGLFGKRWISLAAAAFLLLLPCRVDAQRVMPGQWSVSLAGGVSPFADDTPFIGELVVEHVTHTGLWTFQVNGIHNTSASSYAAHSFTTSDDDGNDVVVSKAYYSMNTFDLYGSAGYLFALWRSRSRAFNIYAGGTIDAGVRMRLFSGEYDPSRVPSTGFLYGGTPEVRFEFFPFIRLSTALSLRAPIHGALGSISGDDSPSERLFSPSALLSFIFYL